MITVCETLLIAAFCVGMSVGSCPTSPIAALTSTTYTNCNDPSLTISFANVLSGVQVVFERFSIAGIRLPAALELNNASIEIRNSAFTGESQIACRIVDSNISFVDFNRSVAAGGTFLDIRALVTLNGVNRITLEHVRFLDPIADVSAVGIKFPSDSSATGLTAGSLQMSLDQVKVELNDGSTEMDAFSLLTWRRNDYQQQPGYSISGFSLSITGMSFNVRSFSESLIFIFEGVSMQNSQIALKDSAVDVALMTKGDPFLNTDTMVFSFGVFADSNIVFENINVQFSRPTNDVPKTLHLLRGYNVNFTRSDIHVSQAHVAMENKRGSAMLLRFRAEHGWVLRQPAMDWIDTQISIQHSSFNGTGADVYFFDTYAMSGQNVSVDLRDDRASFVTTGKGIGVRMHTSECNGCRIVVDNVTFDGRSVLFSDALTMVTFGNSNISHSKVSIVDSVTNCMDTGLFNTFLSCYSFSTYAGSILEHMVITSRNVRLLGKSLALGLISANTSQWNQVNYNEDNSVMNGAGFGFAAVVTFLNTPLANSSFTTRSITVDIASYLHAASWFTFVDQSHLSNVTIESIESLGTIRAVNDPLISNFLRVMGGSLVLSFISRSPILEAAWFILDGGTNATGCTLLARSVSLLLNGSDASVGLEISMSSALQDSAISWENFQLTVPSEESHLAAGAYFHGDALVASSTIALSNTAVELESRSGGAGSMFFLVNSPSVVHNASLSVDGGSISCSGGNASALALLNQSQVDNVAMTIVASALSTQRSPRAEGFVVIPNSGKRTKFALTVQSTTLFANSLRNDSAAVRILADAATGSEFAVELQNVIASVASPQGRAILVSVDSDSMATSTVTLMNITATFASPIGGAVMSSLSPRTSSIQVRDSHISAVGGRFTLLEVNTDAGTQPPSMRPDVRLEDVVLSGAGNWAFVAPAHGLITGTKAAAMIQSSCVGIESSELFHRDAASSVLDDVGTNFVYAPLSFHQQLAQCPFQPSRTASLQATPSTRHTMSNQTSRTVTATAAAARLGCGDFSIDVVAFAGILSENDSTPSPSVIKARDVAERGLSVLLVLEESKDATWSSVGSGGVSLRCESDDRDAEKRCNEFIRTRRVNDTAAPQAWDPRHSILVSFAADVSLELFADVVLVLQPMSASFDCDLDNTKSPEARVHVNSAVPDDVQGQATAATVAAVGGAAAAAVSPGAAMDAQALAVFSLISCGSPGDRYAMKRANFLLTPGTLGPGPEGNIAFNLMMMVLLLVVPLVLSLLWHLFKQRALGRSSSMVNLHMMLRYPSLYVKLAMLFHQGTAIVSLRLVFDGRASAISVIGMAVALLFPWVMYAYGRVLTRPSFDQAEGRMVFFKYEGIEEMLSIPAALRGIVMRLFVPVGKWGPGKMSKRFGGTVSSTMPLWTLYGSLPLFQASAVCVIAAVHTGSRTGCIAQFGTLMLMNFLFGVAVCIARPYRSGFLVLGQAVSSFILVVILALMAALAINPEAKGARRASTFLMSLMGASGGLRTIYALCLTFVEPRVLRKYLTKLEWWEIRDSSSTKDMFRQLSNGNSEPSSIFSLRDSSLASTLQKEQSILDAPMLSSLDHQDSLTEHGPSSSHSTSTLGRTFPITNSLDDGRLTEKSNRYRGGSAPDFHQAAV